MKKTLTLFTLVLAFTACRKEYHVEPIPIITPQIIHETINQELAYQRHLEADLNHDGIYDYSFASLLIATGGKGYLYLSANGDGASGAKIMLQNEPDPILGNFWASPLTVGTRIGPEVSAENAWNVYKQRIYLLAKTPDGSGSGTYFGPWKDRVHTYLAIKFKIAGQYHYGWISISQKLGEGRLIIEDFAYNNKAGEPIAAGQYYINI